MTCLVDRLGMRSRRGATSDIVVLRSAKASRRISHSRRKRLDEERVSLNAKHIGMCLRVTQTTNHWAMAPVLEHH